MKHSLATRLTALYVGTTFALLLAIFAVLTIGTLRLYGRVTGDALSQASREATALFAAQRTRGAAFDVAARSTLADMRRPILSIAFVDGQNRVFGDMPGRSPGGAGALLAMVAGVHVASLPVSGGRLYVGPNTARFVERLGEYWRIAFPIELGVILLSYVVGRYVTRQAIAPLRDVTVSLRALAQGNFVARPVTTAERDEIGDLARAYNAAALQVQTAFGERERSELRMRQFIADAGHELRTPLTVIMGYLENLEDGAIRDPALVRRVYATMRGESRRMRRLVERLILLARLDRPEPSVPRSLAFGELVGAGLEPFVPSSPNLRVEIDPIARSASLWGDADELREAVACVVDNALKYAPGGPVRLIADRVDDTLRLQVRDAGPGMTPEDVTRAFERFYRGSSRGEVEGSGLGLSIARRAVERAGGTLKLKSDPAQGTTVTMCIPLERAVAASPATSAGARRNGA